MKIIFSLSLLKNDFSESLCIHGSPWGSDALRVHLFKEPSSCSHGFVKLGAGYVTLYLSKYIHLRRGAASSIQIGSTKETVSILYNGLTSCHLELQIVVVYPLLGEITLD